ncbi:MAG: transporter [Sphingomonas sp.]
MAAPPAAAPQRAAATPAQLQAELDAARAEIEAQQHQLEAQDARLRTLEARMQTLVAAQPAGPATTPPPALAQTPTGPQPPVEQVGERPADSDRPPEVAVLGSEGSIVTRKGQLTGELQLDYARADRNRALFRGIEVIESVLVGEFNINESRQDILTASLGARYGLTDRFEIGARVPFVHRADNSVLVPVQGSTNNDQAREIDTAATGTGIGDVELTARYQLITGHAGSPFVVGNLQVIAPTGSNPFAVPRLATGEATKAATGSGFWGVAPSLTAILPSDPAVLFGTIGYTHNFGRGVDTVIPPVRISYVKPGDAINFTAGIGVALNERASLNLGYSHSWAFGTRTRTELANPGPNDPGPAWSKSRSLQVGRLLFGVTYRATDRASINWSVEVGATDDAPDVHTVLRIPLILLAS